MVFKFFFSFILIYLLSVCNLANSNNLALPCYGCHASNATNIPNIKGLSSEYFIKAFIAYKNDKREHYIMRIISKGYSDEEIRILARYFEEIDEN